MQEHLYETPNLRFKTGDIVMIDYDQMAFSRSEKFHCAKRSGLKEFEIECISYLQGSFHPYAYMLKGLSPFRFFEEDVYQDNIHNKKLLNDILD